MTYNVFSGTLNPTHFTSLLIHLFFLLAVLATPLNMQASIFGACPKPGLKWEGCGRKGIRHKSGGWRWVAMLFSPDGVAPIQIVGASASVIFLCTIKSRRIFLLELAHPGGPRKRVVKQLCVCVVFMAIFEVNMG